MVSLSSFFYLLLLQQMLQVVIACDALQFIPVGGQPGEPFVRRGLSFVSDIVGAARKAVDDLDRLAQPGGHEQGGNREIFVMIDGH